MDPVTAVGLALGVLPLIITVFEDYKAAIHPFFKLKDSRKLAQRFGKSLQVQQTLFENECQHLLRFITSEGPDMLNNPGHHLWKDRELERKLCAYLNNSMNSCVAIIRLIKEVLSEIRKGTHDGFTELQRPKEESKASLPDRVIQKFKLAFSEEDFNSKLSLLRKYNQDLRALVVQVHRLEKDTADPVPPRKPNSKVIASYRTIRAASHRLYDTLSHVWTCPKHSEHSANICLEEDPSRVAADKVTFDVVLTLSRPLKTSSRETQMWATIESMREQFTEISERELIPITRHNIQTLSESQETRGKVVNFALPEATESTVLESATLDLSSVQDLCIYLQTCLHTSATFSPIGYLARNNTFRQVIYPPRTTKPSGGTVTSLSDAFLAAKSVNGMLIPEKLRLAKIIALAVLQFYSTPWLNENWRSEDILFFNLEDPSQDSLGCPYLTARFVNTTKAATCELPNPTAPKVKSLFLAPNMILFRLGVILLELGLEMKLSNLQDIPEDEERQSMELNEYVTARRLALSSAVMQKMGPRYSKIVNRCLFCDFGLGDNYELDTALQSMFFNNVVLELEACLKLVVENES